MCNFHSILGLALGWGKYEILHDPSNSHSGMVTGIENKPHQKPVIFEAECSAEKLIATADIDSIKAGIIRNFGECPEPLVRKIVTHYQRVREALINGKHLNNYFADTKKWADVWGEAIANNAPVIFPEVFEGSLAVHGSASLDAPQLKEVGGKPYKT